MSIIRITREFSFEGAHALKGYDGKCSHIHGHSYRLAVTVTGKPIAEENSPKKGMVIDFTDLKKIVGENIIDRSLSGTRGHVGGCGECQPLHD